MLAIEWADIVAILDLCRPYFIGLAVITVIAVLVMILCRKSRRAVKFMIRSQAVMALVLAVIMVVNLICFGPMSSMINLATGSGTLTAQTMDEATTLVEEIANEGVVLLENDGLLPLQSGQNLNIFGWGSIDPNFGGSGSGAMNDLYPIIELYEGLENAGFQLNTDLYNFYTEYCAERPAIRSERTLPEPPVDRYSEELMSNAVDFSDTAMIVITRMGGERDDYPMDMSNYENVNLTDNEIVTFTDNSEKYHDFEEGDHYLQLSTTEEQMVELVCSRFDNVILLYNGATTFELGFVKDHPQIRSVVWCSSPGQSGFNSFGRVLNGDVNPSGRTPDTFVADLTDTPTWNNFGEFIYQNMQEFHTSGKTIGSDNKDFVPTFVNYVENIYVGYRFYETAAAEGLIDYDETVLYPFGYGLSYTDFQQTMGPMSVNDRVVSFHVEITNTGTVAGKDVVQVYYEPPYTNGGIEKSTANLVAFDKTTLLAPGESETVDISFNLEDMASYDVDGHGCYVLEQGDYVISINRDSHNVIDTQTYIQNADIIYGESNPRSTDTVAATNLFAFAAGGVNYLSRTDGFANYADAVAAPTSLNMSDENKQVFVNNSNWAPQDYNDPDDVMPTQGAGNGLQLIDLRGAEYDDPRWESLLDQMTVDEMNNLIAVAGFQTGAVESVGKVATTDCDGPSAINNNFTGVGSVGFPSAIMIASTWNIDLAEAFGRSIGTMADEMNVSGWYAPAMNIHRSAFGGRAFEYYSEDGLLSGKMAAKAVSGSMEKGVYTYLKHFVLNEQETNRYNMLCTWVNEQAMREIYFRPFELAVKEGGSTAVMSSYNYIGGEWTATSDELLNGLLREEWGFQGMVLTDYYSSYAGWKRGYMDGDRCIRNGNDALLATYDVGDNYIDDTDSATSILAMRQACKNIMYTVVNSRAYEDENINIGLLPWQMIAIVVDVILCAAFVALELTVVRKGYHKRTKEGNDKKES